MFALTKRPPICLWVKEDTSLLKPFCFGCLKSFVKRQLLAIHRRHVVSLIKHWFTVLFFFHLPVSAESEVIHHNIETLLSRRVYLQLLS